MDEGWWDPSQLPSALQSAPSSPVVPSKKQALLSSDGVKPLILHLLSRWKLETGRVHIVLLA